MVMDKLKYYVEKNAFGVCTYIGERLGIPVSRIRLYFIYTSCITMGSPLIIYLAAAFWLNLKKYIRKKETIWDTLIF